MPTDNPRFSITVPGELLEEIDDFRYENRIPNRTKAVTELIRLGLEVVKRQKEAEGKKT